MSSPWRREVEPTPAIPGTTDAELVRQAQMSPHAFAGLYLRYRDRVLNYCYYRLGNWDEAEDAASATFIKALDHLPAFVDRGDSFRTWLFRIAHNEVADRHRRHGRHPETPFDDALTMVDPAPLPEERAIALDQRARLTALLAVLPARERSVMELRVAELSTREVAQVLQISEVNARTAQSRAIRRLRDLQDSGVTSREAVNA